MRPIKPISLGLAWTIFLSAAMFFPPAFSKQVSSSSSSPKNPDQKAFFDGITRALTGDQWAKCLKLSDDYLAKHNGDALAHGIRGYSLVQMNRDAEALKELNFALSAGSRIIPAQIAEDHSTDLLALRGFAKLRVGRIQEGINDIESSLKRPPLLIGEYVNQRIDFRNLSAAYGKLGDKVKAGQYARLSDIREREFQQIFQPDNMTETAAKKRVISLKRELAASPKSSVISAQLASLLFKIGDDKGALKCISDTILMEPYMMRARLLRFDILKKMGREREAEPDLTAILRFIERPSGSAFSAGDRMTLSARLTEIYKRSGNIDGQLRVFKSVADSGTAGESQYYDLAQLYVAKKDWKNALDAYGDALEFAVDNRPLIYEQRAKVHKILGHLKEANADEAEAVRLKNKARKL